MGKPIIQKMWERDVPGLIDALRHEDLEVRWRAAETLGRIGDARAVEPLITAFQPDKWGERDWHYAEALGKIGDPRAAEPLIAAVEDEDSLVRSYAIWALGQIGDVRVVGSLTSALKDKYFPNVRRVAAEALGKIGDERAVEPLTAALDDDVQDVRDTAREALAKIRRKAAGSVIRGQ